MTIAKINKNIKFNLDGLNNAIDSIFRHSETKQELRFSIAMGGRIKDIKNDYQEIAQILIDKIDKELEE